MLKKAFQDCMQIRSAARLELLILDNSLIWGLAKLVLNSHVLMNSYDPRSSRKKNPFSCSLILDSQTLTLCWKIGVLILQREESTMADLVEEIVKIYCK